MKDLLVFVLICAAALEAVRAVLQALESWAEVFALVLDLFS